MKWIIQNLLLALWCFSFCVAQEAQAQIVVDETMSGSWYDPSHDGEGFVLQVLANDSAVVYWFTYDESGKQRWFIATGVVGNSTIVFDTLQQTSGANFGEDFDSDDVVFADIGELSITWSDCFAATATYTVNGTQGSQSLTRLSALAGLDCESPGLEASAVSGSWFDQTHNGEGLAIEALADGRVVVYWFSYDANGSQAWFLGVGEQNETGFNVEVMNITSGGRFGPGFDPADVELASWGSIDVELGCEFGKLDYASLLPGFGEGKQTLSRLTSIGNPSCEEPQAPNILLVIADDLGKDASSIYGISDEQPVTPTLDQLAAEGLVFENAWSSPTCSPTRAGILTGKYGSRTGVLQPGNPLSIDETSLHSYIKQHLPGKYSDAVIGKWHLAEGRNNLDHPNVMGVSHFSGILGGGVGDYENWELVTDGASSDQTTYTTTKLVDLAVEWTGAQDQPWFLWLAFNAPHTPFHLPPESLHDRSLSGSAQDIEDNPQPYYFAAIEAMDTELGRLLDSLDEETRNNTIVIFMGDNGTPGQVAQSPYSRQSAKGSLNQGGINIPFFVSGPGVTRMGEREMGLVNTTDLFSTISSLAGVNVDQVNDSISFAPLLGEEQQSERFFQFSEKSDDDSEEWAVSDGLIKIIESTEGDQQVFDLSNDPYEEDDLAGSGVVPGEVIDDLQFLADEIRNNNP